MGTLCLDRQLLLEAVLLAAGEDAHRTALPGATVGADGELEAAQLLTH